MLCTATSASPTGHGGATGHRSTQRDRGGRGNCRGGPNQHSHRRCYNLVFPGQEGVCRLLGGMLQSIYRPSTHITRPFPDQSARCHHAASFLAISPVAHSRNFGTTNYVTRTYTHTYIHHTRTRLWDPTPEPCSELKVRLWREYYFKIAFFPCASRAVKCLPAATVFLEV